MSDVHEFNPRTFTAERRKRLARIANAAVEPPWPAVEKQTLVKASLPHVPMPPKPEPAPKARSYRTWFSIEDVEPAGFQPTIREIQVVVSAYYHISTMNIRSALRTQDIVKPRQIAMYLARELALKTMPEIGRYFGGRDHTTVLHAIRRTEALIGKDPIFAGEVAELTRRLGGEAASAA